MGRPPAKNKLSPQKKGAQILKKNSKKERVTPKKKLLPFPGRTQGFKG